MNTEGEIVNTPLDKQRCTTCNRYKKIELFDGYKTCRTCLARQRRAYLRRVEKLKQKSQSETKEEEEDTEQDEQSNKESQKEETSLSTYLLYGTAGLIGLLLMGKPSQKFI